MTQETRFGFGKNWKNFLQDYSKIRLNEASKSICQATKLKTLEKMTFCDVGSGSGLFSAAAAVNLKAKAVYSFDYDKDSVESTKLLKSKIDPNNKNWTIDQGSVLDLPYIKKLGTFDMVYSWGVLHHTGAMYQAFDNVCHLVKPGGLLFISIYNDQGVTSKIWHLIKKIYNKSGCIGKKLMIFITFLRCWSKTILIDTLKHGNPLKTWKNYPNNNMRGMSAYYDLIDWVGGYPFEVASSGKVSKYFESKGFSLQYLKDCNGGLGCNEFIFCKVEDKPAE